MPYCLSFLSTSTADIISKYPIVQTLAYSEKDPCNRRHRHTTRTLARSPYLALSIRKYLGVEEAEPTENENVHISLKSSPLKLLRKCIPFEYSWQRVFYFKVPNKRPSVTLNVDCRCHWRTWQSHTLNPQPHKRYMAGSCTSQVGEILILSLGQL
jgi:hypothetical protein